MPATGSVSSGTNPNYADIASQAVETGYTGALRALMQKRQQEFEMGKIQAQWEHEQGLSSATVDWLKGQNLIPGGGQPGQAPTPSPAAGGQDTGALGAPAGTPVSPSVQPKIPAAPPTAQPTGAISPQAAPGILQLFERGGFKNWQELEMRRKAGASNAGIIEGLADNPNISPKQKASLHALANGMREGNMDQPGMDKIMDQVMPWMFRPDLVGAQPGVIFDPARGLATVTSQDNMGKVTVRQEKMTAQDYFAYFNRKVNELAVNEANLTPGQKSELANARRNVETWRPFALPPGATIVSRETGLPGGPGGPPAGGQPGAPGQQPYVGAPPGTRAYNPTQVPEATTERYANAMYTVHEMSQLANELEALPRESQDRVSQGLRYELQNLKIPGTHIQPLQSIGLLTPQEQDIATRLRHAQIRYEQAVSGIRGAGSPQMYDRFTSLIGPLYGVNTPTSIRGLASAMSDYTNDVRTLEASQGRRALPTPTFTPPGPQAPPPYGQPAPGAAGVSTATPFSQWRGRR